MDRVLSIYIRFFYLATFRYDLVDHFQLIDRSMMMMMMIAYLLIMFNRSTYIFHVFHFSMEIDFDHRLYFDLVVYRIQEKKTVSLHIVFVMKILLFQIK